MKGTCAFCGGKLKAPCWIRRFGPSSPYHLNPGRLCRYCSKICYTASIRADKAMQLTSKAGPICSVCGKTFSYDDIMSSDAPMCDECAEKEWQESKKPNKENHD